MRDCTQIFSKVKIIHTDFSSLVDLQFPVKTFRKALIIKEKKKENEREWKH